VIVGSIAGRAARLSGGRFPTTKGKTMYLKIMSAEDLPDSDPKKSFRILEILDASFTNGEASVTFVDSLDAETFDIPANAYLMNESGKTVAQYKRAAS
jgi:hypothetical protein